MLATRENCDPERKLRPHANWESSLVARKRETRHRRATGDQGAEAAVLHRRRRGGRLQARDREKGFYGVAFLLQYAFDMTPHALPGVVDHKPARYIEAPRSR